MRRSVPEVNTMNKAAARASLTAANSFDAEQRSAGRRTGNYRLQPRLPGGMFPGIAHLPFSVRVLLEESLRREDGRFAHAEDVEALARLAAPGRVGQGDRLHPQPRPLAGFYRRPSVVDLAAMREAMQRLGGDPAPSTRSNLSIW